MKRVILVLLSFWIVSTSFAQSDDKLIISNDNLVWNCPNQIIGSEKGDTIYVAFGNNDKICLTPDVKSINRGDLDALLTADKGIFCQVITGQVHSYKKAGFLVGKETAQVLDCARVIIEKDELPITLTFNNSQIRIVEFDPDNPQDCELIRKRANFYKSLPDCKKDTISIDELRDFSVSAISLATNNDAWKLSAKYFIDSTECKLQNDTIFMTKDLWASVKDKKNIKINYEIDCTHEYFSHKRKGIYYEIYVIWPWWEYVWRALVGISLIALVVVVIIYICKHIKKKCKSFKQRIPNECYEGFTSGCNQETKLALISQLLSDVDDNFREKVLNIIGTETSSPILVTPNNPESPEQTSIIEKLNEKTEELNVDITNLSKQIADKDKAIETLQGERNELSLKFAKAITANKSLSDENTKLNDKIEELCSEIDSLKSIIADKDKQIEQHLQKIKTLKDQLASISRQNMYLLQIDDVLKGISEDILVAVENVENEDLKKKLVLPLLNGVTGLDEGLTTYYKRWQDQVMKVQHNFFGKDLYEMSDDEVKTKLVSGFLKNLALGDTFSKLTKLYMYIQADWINGILIKNKFNVDKIEQIFNRLKMLFNDFGIEIIYPRLFVDKMNDHLYTFDPRCEVFKLFPISEEMRMTYSKQIDLIVDIIQIGVKIPVENYSRKAIVSIPNF